MKKADLCLFKKEWLAENRVVDRHEQYSCRNCMFVYVVKESENEDTDIVVT